jgi:hypothetical protein
MPLTYPLHQRYAFFGRIDYSIKTMISPLLCFYVAQFFFNKQVWDNIISYLSISVPVKISNSENEIYSSVLVVSDIKTRITIFKNKP